jgi:hypothetical protein
MAIKHKKGLGWLRGCGIARELKHTRLIIIIIIF